jgi:hypothetical protein
VVISTTSGDSVRPERQPCRLGGPVRLTGIDMRRTMKVQGGAGVGRQTFRNL